MNKLNKLFAGFAAVAMLAACSNDEPAMPDQPVTDGQTAYMNIRIQAATGMSRSTTTPGYDDGNTTENAVKSVRFFFFDKDGAYMDLTAYLVKNDDANITVTPKDPAKDNVEAVFGSNLLVLENLTGFSYPNYMVTVINRPTFNPGNNLKETLEALDDHKNGDYFVMSTASYAGENDHHDNTYYHATKLKTSDFKQTPDAAIKGGSTVSVYVERLAAKVQVGMAEKMENTTTVNGETLYKLESTLAGGDNTGDANLADELYIRVLGWDLNTTVNDSYMCKNIDPTWSFNWGTNGSWNNATDFRSYWSKSTIYNQTLAQASGKLTYVDTKKWKEGDTQDLNALGTTAVEYCNENTNDPSKIFSKETTAEGSTEPARALIDSRIATNVVLYTQLCNAQGEPVKAVMANGILFKMDSYLQYIINRAYALNNNEFNIWEKGTSNADKVEGGTMTTTNYQQIGTGYFSLVLPPKKTEEVKDGYEGVGDVNVVVNEEVFANKTFYKKGTDENGKIIFTELTAEEVAAAIAALKAKIAAVQPTGTNHAVIYENGKNVYYIPIQHLGAVKDQKDVVEGYYGVVRNHWYKLTISKFSKVGHGIWDPEEDNSESLVPDKPEDPLYYLGADINILSWKIVDQNVDL